MFFGSPEHLTFLRYKVLSPQRRYDIISLRPHLGDIGLCINAVVSDMPGYQQHITSVYKAMASAPNMAARWRQCMWSIWESQWGGGGDGGILLRSTRLSPPQLPPPPPQLVKSWYCLWLRELSFYKIKPVYMYCCRAFSLTVTSCCPPTLATDCTDWPGCPGQLHARIIMRLNHEWRSSWKNRYAQ